LPFAPGKSAVFSPDEIAGRFGPDGTPDLPRAEPHVRAHAPEARIGGLTALRNALRHLAECPDLAS
jgi:hypothetical protein